MTESELRSEGDLRLAEDLGFGDSTSSFEDLSLALLPLAETTPRTLFAVCDLLVLRALEAVGKRVVKSGQHRALYREFTRGTPWFLAHTVCAPDEASVRDVLATSWSLVPLMVERHGCCGITVDQIRELLDSYVRDLLITGTPHTLDDLRYRFERDTMMSVTEGD